MKITWLPILGLVFLAACQEKSGEDSVADSANLVNPTLSNMSTQPATATGAKQIFVLSTGSKVEFSGSTGTGDIAGSFGNFTGKFEIEDGGLVKSGRNFITIDMASLDAEDQKLNEAMKHSDFFDVEKYPIARFQLREATAVDNETIEISAVLDMHGTSRKIQFPATFAVAGKGTLMDLSGEVPIKFSEFGIEKTPGSAVPDEMVLKISLTALPGEPVELVLGGTNGSSETETRNSGPGGRSRGGWGGSDRGKGRIDWRNMTEEERAERRKQFMAEIDKNQDGILAKDEMSERMWSYMGRADKNGDNQVTEAERNEHRAEREAERQLRELSGEEYSRDGDRSRRGGSQ